MTAAYVRLRKTLKLRALARAATLKALAESVEVKLAPGDGIAKLSGGS